MAPNIVITAAHCTTTPTEITIGRYDLDAPDDYDYEVMNVLEKIIHPQYDKEIVEVSLLEIPVVCAFGLVPHAMFIEMQSPRLE